MRLLMRLLTYARPAKYPAASSTITNRIGRIARDEPVLSIAIGATITAIFEQYMSNGNRHGWQPMPPRGGTRVFVAGLL